MTGVSSSLELDFSGAIAGAEELGAQLDASLAEAAASFEASIEEALTSLSSGQTIEDVDASAVEEAIQEAIEQGGQTPVEIEASIDDLQGEIAAALAESDPVIEVDAETAEAEARLEELAALADATDFNIEVEADTTAAETAIENIPQPDPIEVEVDSSGFQALESDAAGASDSLGGLSSAASGASAASDLATGSVAGLSAAATSAPGPLGEIAAVAAAVGGGLALMVNAAIEDTASIQRLTQAAGEFASQLDVIDVAGLNVPLEELAISLGSSDDGIRQAAASLINLNVAAGATQEEATKTAEDLIALASRAVALNPALGDVGTVADSLNRGLARGGRFAAQYGIDLSAAEINARALANTGKTTTAELTFQEKATAGAQLAMEKYGDTIQGDVLAGTENLTIQVRALKAGFEEALEAIGKPLVTPALDILRAGIPVAEALAGILGDIGAAILPGLAPPLEALGTILSDIGDQLAPVFEAAEPVITEFGQALAEALLAARPLFEALIENQTELLPLTLSLARAATTLLEAFEPLIGPISEIAAVVSRISSAPTVALATAAGFLAESIAEVVDVIAGGVFDAFNTAAEAAGDVVTFLAGGVEFLSDEIPGLEAALGILADTLGIVGDAFALVGDVVGTFGGIGEGVAADLINSLPPAMRDAALAAREESDAADAAGDSLEGVKTKADEAAGSSEELAGALDPAVTAMEEAATAADELKTRMDALIGVHLSAEEAAIAYRDSVAEVRAKLDEQVAAVGVASLGLDELRGTVIDATSDALSLADAFIRGGGDAETAALGIAVHRQAMFDLLTQYGIAPEEVNAFLSSIGLTPAALAPADEALDRTGGKARDLGPKARAGADEYKGAVSELPGATQSAADEANLAADTFSQIGGKAGQAGRDASTQFQTGIGGTKTAASTETNAAAAAIAAQSPLVIAAATTMGRDAGHAFGAFLEGGFKDGGARAPGVAGQAIAAAAGSVQGQAQSAGVGVGASFGQGIVSGIDSYVGSIASAAARAVQAAEGAARAEAQSASPSKLFARLGRDLGAGLEAGLAASVPAVQVRAADLIGNAAERARASFSDADRSFFSGQFGRVASAVGGQPIVIVMDTWEDAVREFPQLASVGTDRFETGRGGR